MIQFKNKHLTVFESALFRTTSTVVVTDDLVLVADPTWLPAEVAAIHQYVEALRGTRPVYLLFTHSDYDHILGYGAFPDARVIASAAFVNNPDPEAQIRAIHKFDQEYYVRRPYEMVYPKVDIVIGPDMEFITIGDTRLSFRQAPGHNADGLFTLLEPLGIWIAGDYLSNEEFPFIYHSTADYLQTLDVAEDLIRKRRPKYLVPGHGDVTVETREMLLRLKDSRHYIQQMQEAVVSEKDFPEAALWKRYNFRMGQESFHQNNLSLMHKEREAAGGQL